MNESQKESIGYITEKKDGYSFSDLCLIVELLRGEGGCPWDREQTHKSIRRDLIEETYEVIEAIDNDDPMLMREELGDLLLQAVFHAQIEKESGNSDIGDITDGICRKLIHRHPHVFGEVVADTSEQVLVNWDKIKTAEKHRDTVTSQLRAVPPALPALMRAQKIGKKVAFFDFDGYVGALDKLAEESNEVREAAETGNRDMVFEEVGDLLFTAVSVARKLGVDAEEALTRANEKFILRFSMLEDEVMRRGEKVNELSMPELDAVWDDIKHKNN